MINPAGSTGSTGSTRAAPAARARFARRANLPVLALAGYLVLGLALTARLWVAPNARLVGGNPDDIALYSWFLTWDVHALWAGHSPLISYALNAPVGVSAMWNTSLLLPSLIFGWLVHLAGALVVYNLLTLLAPVTSAWAAFVVLRAVHLRGPAAFVGGLVFGFSPAIVQALIGHVTVAFAALVPILIYLAVDAVVGERPAWRSGLWLGLATVAQLFIGEELLFCSALAAGLVLLVLAASRPREVARHVRHAGVAGAVALAVVGLLAGYPLYVQFFGPLHQHGSAFTTNYFTADLTGFVTPSRHMLLHTTHSAAVADAFRGGPSEYLAYLGWPLIVVALVTAVVLRRDLRARVAAIGAAVFAVLSLGDTLHVHNEDTGLHLPWGWLTQLPVAQSALATRLSLPVALFAALLLALAVDALAGPVVGGRTRLPPALRALRPVHAHLHAHLHLHARLHLHVLGAVGVAALCVLPLVPRPLPVASAPPVPEFFSTTARALPSGARLLVLPFPTATETAPMRWQAAARIGFAMPGGYFTGPARDGHAYIGGDSPQPTARLLIDVAKTGEVPVLTAQQRADAATDFAFWGIDAVVLGPCTHRAELHRLMVQLLHHAPVYAGGVAVWQL